MSSTRTSQSTVLIAALAVLLIASACGAVAGLRADSVNSGFVGPVGAIRPTADVAAVEVPAVEVPAVEVPAVEVPAVEVPAVEAPAHRASLIGPTPAPEAPQTFGRQASDGAERAQVASPSGWPTPDASSSTIVLVGDSLAEETSGVIAMLTALKAFVPRYWGGTAPCDWLDDDLLADRSSVVVITFTGNSLTPCMSDGAGGHLEHEAFAAKYRADLTELVDHARRTGARVVLVGQPYRSPSFDHADRVDAINGVIQELAQAYLFVSYVDAGSAVETTDGSFSDRLPCRVLRSRLRDRRHHGRPWRRRALLPGRERPPLPRVLVRSVSLWRCHRHRSEQPDRLRIDPPKIPPADWVHVCFPAPACGRAARLTVDDAGWCTRTRRLGCGCGGDHLRSGRSPLRRRPCAVRAWRTRPAGTTGHSR